MAKQGQSTGNGKPESPGNINKPETENKNGAEKPSSEVGKVEEIKTENTVQEAANPVEEIKPTESTDGSVNPVEDKSKNINQIKLIDLFKKYPMSQIQKRIMISTLKMRGVKLQSNSFEQVVEYDRFLEVYNEMFKSKQIK